MTRVDFAALRDALNDAYELNDAGGYAAAAAVAAVRDVASYDAF